MSTHSLELKEQIVRKMTRTHDQSVAPPELRDGHLGADAECLEKAVPGPGDL